MRLAWKFRIVEVREVYYEADTQDEALELLRAGNEPSIEDVVELFVGEHVEHCDIESAPKQLQLEVEPPAGQT